MKEVVWGAIASWRTYIKSGCDNSLELKHFNEYGMFFLCSKFFEDSGNTNFIAGMCLTP